MIEPSFREFKAKGLVDARDKSKNTFAVLISKSNFFENLAKELGPNKLKHAALTELFTQFQGIYLCLL